MRQTELDLTDEDRLVVEPTSAVRHGRRGAGDGTGVFSAANGPPALDDDRARTGRAPGARLGQRESRNRPAHAKKKPQAMTQADVVHPSLRRFAAPCT